MQWIKHKQIYVERDGDRAQTKQLYWFLPQTKRSLVPLHFQGIFTIITKYYKCPSTQARDFQCSSTKARDFYNLT